MELMKEKVLKGLSLGSECRNYPVQYPSQNLHNHHPVEVKQTNKNENIRLATEMLTAVDH